MRKKDNDGLDDVSEDARIQEFCSLQDINEIAFLNTYYVKKGRKRERRKTIFHILLVFFSTSLKYRYTDALGLNI